MLQNVKYTFSGIRQDITKSKHPAEFYFEADHVRIVSTDSQSTGSIINEKGNEKIIDLGSITINTSTNTITNGSFTLGYTNNNELDQQISNGDVSTTSGTQKIIGHAAGRDSVYLISTDDNGFDVIWEISDILNGSYNLSILYIRNMNLSSNNPVQIIYNYENENIQKIYWVDGINQLRFINIKEDNLIDVALNTLNFVGDFDLSQPVLDSISSGGNHTAGMVQYAYNLYRLNSSQTKLSPLSEIIPLSKGQGLGGGDVNELVSTTPVIEIPDLDTEYTHIKVYAIRYTSLNQIPSVELIEEREIGSTDSIKVFDDGSNIRTLSLEELIFLGSDPIIPQHIITKDNVLFPVNIKEQNFDLPDEFDMRAYSWSALGTCAIYDNISAQSNGTPTGSRLLVNSTTYNVPIKHDTINLSYEVFKYQQNGTTLGGEGKFIKYEIVQKSLTDPEDYRVFKDREVYRIGIQFYNKLGQVSFVKWIADFKAPSGNLQGNYNTLKVELKSEFTTFLNNYTFENENDRPVGYKIVRANRNESDKTILAQGILTSMIFQVKGDEAKNFNQFTVFNNRKNFQDGNLKLPSYLTREFQKVPNTSSGDNNGVLQEAKHLEWLNDDNASFDEGGEIYTVTNSNNKLSQTFQFTKMMQLHSPEVLFDRITRFPSDTNLRTVGLCKSTANGVYGEERFIETKLEKFGGRTLGGINPKRISTSLYIENNSFRNVFDTPEGGASNNNNRFIGPTGGGPELTMGFYQYYRAFNTFINDTRKEEYSIYGTPEISVRGGDSRFYNNDARYNYTNSLTPFISDGEDDCDTCPGISNINSFGSQATTIMLGEQSDNTDNRFGLEDLYTRSNLSDTNGVLLSEIVRDPNFTYLGNIYGGNSYEEKKRSNYVEIGSYSKITSTTLQIDSPGDTYVQNFKFLRIAKTDTEVYSHQQLQKTELIEFPVETTIDLKNRNDISLNAWDSRFQPREEEYHKYNTVYSQQPTLIQNTDVDFNFQKVKNFDTRISASKRKIPNENIDSWTDLLVNEVQDLDGKYGPINAVINHRDELYTLQDEALAKIIVNPRVQIQGANGLDIELGRGTLLYDYQYLTTKSGSINKWGIVDTKSSFYYFDALNKGLFRFPDHIVTSLSDAKAMHSFFNNNFDYSKISVDNPVLKSGVIMGYDNYNNDVYLTLHQGDKSYTRVFNELRGEFIDRKLYYPSWYISKGERFFAINNDEIWEQGIGEYNKFFDSYIPSRIILQVNPAVDVDCLFHNIFFRSELYLNDIDQPDKTLTHIRAYNEYQDSGRVPLVVGRNDNIRRKFRQWRADIPRHANSRNRMRNPWIFLELELSNEEDYKLILHDIIINYNIYR